MAAAQDELNQLERVFLRLGLAETDEELQNVISKFLPPVLLKLSSTQEGVRKKVMELLVHLNKRVKSRPKIQLPVETLLVQYQDPAALSFVTNFTIIYIKLGFPRLPLQAQCDLAPTLVNAIGGRPPPQQDSLLQLLMPVLVHLRYPADAARRAALFNLAEKPRAAHILRDFMLDVVLMPYGVVLGAAATGGAAPEGGEGAPRAPPGMSLHAARRLQGEVPWGPEELEQCKLGVVRLAEQDVFAETELLVHLIVASSDSRHSVATAAEMELRRRLGTVDWNNPALVNKLYRVYLGDVPLKTKDGSTMNPEQKREAASTRIKLKITPHLLRSRQAAETFPACIQVVFDGLFGASTNAKLKGLTLQFVHHICAVCPEAKIKPLGPMLLNGLTKLINESKEDSKLRSLAYTAVGKLSSRLPQLFSKDIALVQQFLEALCKEDPEDRLCIQEALSMMAPAYSGLQGADLKLMEALVAGYIEKPELHARLVAVKFASAVFAPDHVASRYLLLLAAGDPKEEVSAEAQRVLRDSPPGDKKDREGRPTPLPPFTEMVAYIQEKASVRIKSPAKYSVGITTLAFNPASYGEMVLYLRACLAGSAGVASPLATESLAQMQTQAPAIRRYVSSLPSVAAAPAPPAAVDGGGGPLHSYVGLIRPLLSAVAGTPIMYCLLEVVAIAPDHLAEQFADKMDWIKGLMSSNREETRELASQLLAVVTAHAPACHLPDAVTALLKSTGDQSPEVQHGAVLALGYLVSRCLAGRQCQDKGRLPDDLVRTAITTIGAFVGNNSPVLSMAGCVALGEIARSGVLPLPDSGSGLSKLSLVETLLAKIRSGKEANKMKEKAVMALGNFSVGDVAFPHQKLVMEGLMDSVEARQVELQLWVAESLVSAARGVDSASRHDVWTEGDAASHSVGGGNDEVAWLLNAVLTRYVPSPNPHVRHAASVWLLSIVQRLGYHPAVKCQLKEIQEAFTGMLSENDELSQDVASKGLALVYEHGTDDDRQQLVSILVETLMTGKRKPQAVTQDTEIFPGEGVGKTPEGQNLTTYKELCSLVSDLNQPDLIYKFMNLANHHAVWNSRKGAAFGFSGIARQAGAQLAPHLPLILPRLYRYQFDPNPGVRQAMMSIWNALVPETKNTVDKYMKEILDDVISNLTVNLWRVRESSCLALKELLRGQQLDEVIERLPEIWATLFRVRDDVKESVRKAADHALKTLSKVSVRLCDPANGASAQKTVAAILPCLLQSGISSQVEEVRSLSVSTLVKISKSAGSLLKPHVTQVIVVLLESLTTLEPQLLNYISVRASQQEQVQMDSVRLNAAKTSPMMETVTMCLQYVDERVLAELMPRLCEMLRSGVGLSTKGGSAHVVVALTAQCPQDLAPYAGKLMVSLLNGLSDRNDVVRKSYAVALGHLVKVSKDSSVEKLLKKLSDWYLDKDDASLRSACALVVHAVSQHSPDALKQHAALALPLAFLGMHEGGDSDAGGGGGNPNGRLWTDVWQDSVPGSSGGVRLYLPELVGVCRLALRSPSWQLKAQGAAALAAVARLHAPSLSPPFLGLVLEALLQGLQGRTWAGKEELLKAISGVVAASSDELKETHPDQPSLEVVLDSLFKEARKDNMAYRTAALACLSDVLQSTREDRFAELAQIVFPVLEKACAGENVISTEAEDDEKSDKDRQQELVSAMFQSLGKAWPDNPTTQGRFRVDVCKFMCSKVKLSHWKLQVVVLQAMKKYTERLSLLSSEHKDAQALTEILQQMLPALTVPLENKSYSSVRSEALDILEIVLTKLKATGQGDALKPHERQVLAASLVTMETDKLPALKDRAASLLLGMQGI